MVISILAIGEFDKDGFLKITDRKKRCSKPLREIYCTTNYRKHDETITFHRANNWWRSKPAAFIQTNFDFIKEWAALHKLGQLMRRLLLMKVIAWIQEEEIDEINLKFGHWGANQTIRTNAWCMVDRGS
jgi:long-chain acyl-CoA synthetase